MLDLGELQGFWARSGLVQYVSYTRASSADVTNVQSTTIDAPVNIAQGNLLLAWVIHDGDNSSDVAASGWTLYSEDTYQSTVGSVLYRWATNSEAANYTFSHTDTTYGGMGGVIVNLKGSAVVGECPIFAVSNYDTYADNANTDITFTCPGIAAAVQGSTVLAMGAFRRDGTVETGPQMDFSEGAYNNIIISQTMGGRGTSGAAIGGGIGYVECASPQTVAAITAGQIIGDVGSLKSTRSWRARSMVVI